MIKKCPHHPKYHFKKKPKHLCGECWSIHLQYLLSRGHSPIKPTQVFKDKKKYNRKIKHKKKLIHNE